MTASHKAEAIDDKPLRVAWDLTPLSGPRTGVGHMVAAYSGRLATSPGIDFCGYAVSFRNAFNFSKDWPAGTSQSTMRLPAFIVYRLWERIDWPRLGGFDIVHGPNFKVPPSKGAAEVLTIHDLTAWHYPELVHPTSLAYPRLADRALNRGAVIHTVSQFVAEEVKEYYKIGDDRVRCIYNGVEPSTYEADVAGDVTNDATNRNGAPYLLAIGTIEPRKDYPTLVRAFDAVAEEFEDLRLVIVGSEGWGTAELDATMANLRFADRIDRVGYVDDIERRRLLQGATAFVYPSIYEGFGLPPLEAMQMGIPTVATRGGSIPEIVGDGALLIDVGDTDALGEALSQIVTDSDLRDTLRRQGERRVKHFSWEKSTSGLVEWYRCLMP